LASPLKAWYDMSIYRFTLKGEPTDAKAREKGR
jgi:hypothetical protein